MPVTALYAGLLTPLFLFLSARVIVARRGARTALGDGGDPALLRRVRVQANFAEYVPLALVLLGLAESLRTPVLVLHALGLALLAGRLVHAFGVSRAPERFTFRVTGTALTLTVLSLAALACLVGVVRAA